VFVRAFLRVLREQGPYDVVHAHLQLFSGLVLRLAHLAGVPVRIAHSRNASDGKQPTLGRRVYRALMLRWLGRYAAHRLAVSREAALGAFGPVLGDLDHCELMSGLDFGPFAGSVDRSRVRKTLGISDRARVIGHVGSFTKKKNHRFLIDVAFRCMERDGDIMLLLVGSGPLEGEIRRTVAASPYGNRVIVLGDRPDVPALMGGAMDAFLLPSLTEGLPRVLLEAQSSGLACVVSTEVTREAAAPCSRVLFVNLTAPISEWCDATNEALRSRSDSLRNEVIAYFEKRGLTTESNARRLTQLYRRLRDECE
jgi:glycosyltransferase involved in cell wall biosynthesis